MSDVIRAVVSNAASSSGCRAIDRLAGSSDMRLRSGWEEDKLSGDMRELYDRLLPSQESENRRAQLVRKLEKMLDDEWPGNDIRVNVFGSSGNLLSSSDSDVDICITTPLKKLESMHSLATLLHRRTLDSGHHTRDVPMMRTEADAQHQMAWRRWSVVLLQRSQL